MVSINVTGDYYEMLNILNKLERNTKKKQHFEKVYKEEGKIIRKIHGSYCFKTEGPPLKDYYAQRPQKIRSSIDKERKKRMNSNMGVAFITFDTPQAQKMFFKQFNEAVKTMKNRGSPKDKLN